MRVQVRRLVLPERSLEIDWECTLSGEERAELGEDWVAFAGLSSLGRSSTPSFTVWVAPRALWVTPFYFTAFEGAVLSLACWLSEGMSLEVSLTLTGRPLGPIL